VVFNGSWLYRIGNFQRFATFLYFFRINNRRKRFFKPTISTLLGNLYSEPEYKDKKDTGYNIFYMGINIGAFVCNIIAAFMRNKFGWGEAFITAGIGMFLGLIIFSFGLKHEKSF
jgi:POT family proton-dependent oligopeptide transporter